MHNQAYVNLQNAGHTLPDFKIIDQFVQEKTYYKYIANQTTIIRNIHFETKAENKYLSVAAASILARNAFLEYWDDMKTNMISTLKKELVKPLMLVQVNL